jgi:hypothetical protein
VPLFDPNAALSLEAPALYQLADRLAECTAFQELNDFQADATLAREKIKICAETDPWDQTGGLVTKDQLESILLEANVDPGDDESHATRVAVGDPEGRCPEERGLIEITLRRQIRDTELADYGADDLYLWFLDRVSAIAKQLHLRADATGQPLIGEVRRPERPKWNPEQARTAQGLSLWAILAVTWGDRGGPRE